MHTRDKRRFTFDEMGTVWQLWSEGKSLSDIGRAINKHAGSVFCFLQKTGGIKPKIPSRSKSSLTLSDREEISRGISAGLSLREVARCLARPPSTISREINRNGGKLKYRAFDADKAAWKKAKRPKPSLLESNIELQNIVKVKLLKKWSPEQISGWLKETYSDQADKQVSHETIYKTLYIQSRGSLNKELQRHLRTKRVMRQSRSFNTKGNPRGGIIDAVSIHDRPKEANDRKIPGHWEGDLICGSKRTFIATLVERSSRFTMLVKLSGNDTDSVVGAIKRKVIDLPDILKKSLTWDRGMELAKHKEFTVDTNVNVYFCDPQSPWQRGTNENTNRLLRQYLPKKTDLSIYNQKELDEIADELNGRPRKTLNFLSPQEKIWQVLH